MTRVLRLGCWLFLAGALLAPRTARAALDEVIGKGASHTETIAGQKLRVRVTGTVRELAGADGKIFAASWTGAANLRALLGTHWAAYESAVRSQRRASLHLLSFSTPELTMHVVAYGRNVQGLVALTQSLPKGVKANALH